MHPILRNLNGGVSSVALRAPFDGSAGGGAQISPQQANMMARREVIKSAVDMWLPIAQQTYNTGVGTVINIPLRNVGLIKRLVVRVAATVQANALTFNLTKLGAANFFSNITFTDLSNQQRINTAGWHLMAVSSAKRRRVYAAAVTTDTPLGYGDNFTSVMAAPSSITTNPANPNVFAYFEVPFAYTDMDLRGAIYANVTNATMNLQLTVNPNLFVSSSADPTLAMYQGTTTAAGLLPSFQITVLQNFLDQLPVAPAANGQPGGVVLPLLDLSTAYLLNNTPVGGIVANQDNPLPYANFRDFMSTTLIYDNNGTLNVGSDINYFALQSANYTNIFKLTPFDSAFLTRLILGDDMPNGMYYFDHRTKPISTIQYGNMALVVNPSSAPAGTSVLVGYESLALINQITQAGSLYGV